MHFSSFTGVKRGDRVAIYMPMIIEIIVAMLACSRIGAVHSVVVSISLYWNYIHTHSLAVQLNRLRFSIIFSAFLDYGE